MFLLGRTRRVRLPWGPVSRRAEENTLFSSEAKKSPPPLNHARTNARASPSTPNTRPYLCSREKVSPRQAGLAIGIGISPGLGSGNEKKAGVAALHTSGVVPATGDTPTRPQHQTVRQRTWRQATLASCARIETDKTATTQLQADDATTCRGLPTTHHKVHAPTVSPGPQGDFPCRPASHSESHEVLATGRRAEDGQRHNFQNAKVVGRECAWEKKKQTAGWRTSCWRTWSWLENMGQTHCTRYKLFRC